MKVYNSAVDAWLAIVLLVTPLGVSGYGFYLLGDSVVGGIIAIATGIVVIALIVLFTVPCKYMVSDRFLEIRCGIFREKIKLEEIQKLSLSSNPLSSPALSLKRIRIDLVKGYRLVSPKEREEFMRNIELIKKGEGQPVAGGDADG